MVLEIPVLPKLLLGGASWCGMLEKRPDKQTFHLLSGSEGTVAAWTQSLLFIPLCCTSWSCKDVRSLAQPGFTLQSFPPSCTPLCQGLEESPGTPSVSFSHRCFQSSQANERVPEAIEQALRDHVVCSLSMGTHTSLKTCSQIIWRASDASLPSSVSKNPMCL